MLSGVLLKLGRYGLILVVPRMKGTLSLFYVTVSVLGASLVSLMCLRQGDMKLLIALSSVVHISVVTLGLLRRSEMGLSCATIMALAHGLCSPMLFAMAHSFYLNSHSRLMVYNHGKPFIMGVFFLLIAINISLPPNLSL